MDAVLEYNISPTLAGNTVPRYDQVQTYVTGELANYVTTTVFNSTNYDINTRILNLQAITPELRYSILPTLLANTIPAYTQIQTYVTGLGYLT